MLYDLLKTQGGVPEDRQTKGKVGSKATIPRKKKNEQASKHQAIVWTSQHQEVLEELIDEIVKPRVMAFPDFEKPYILHTDASQVGLGPILYQKQDDDKLRVVALSPAGKNYHSSKLEFLAMKSVITDRFKDFLYYAPGIEIYTDNNPLTCADNRSLRCHMAETELPCGIWRNWPTTRSPRFTTNVVLVTKRQIP